MKNRIFLGSLAALTMCVACQSPKPADTVHLKGQLNVGANPVAMKYNGAASMLGDSRDILIRTDENGYFDTVIPLSEPAYFDISRNTLYLTPGDDMTVYITQNNEDAVFQGVGAQANNYMKHRLFPKSGSFLEGGSNLRGNFEETKAFIDSMAGLRKSELAALDSVSDVFKTLEGARIRADVLNSYQAYPIYSSIRAQRAGLENTEEGNLDMSPYAKSILPTLLDEQLLDVAAVRYLLYDLFDEENASLAEGLTIPGRTKELYEAAGYVTMLRNEASKAVVDSVAAFVATVQDPEFAGELNNKIEEASKLMAGKPAFDMEITDVDGNICHLSDFKGKVLYVDFWATWCGPCIAESPYFEELSKEYEGKDIVFIPVSQDTDLDEWNKFLVKHKKDLPQYNSGDVNAKNAWQIYYIPRFVVIDKDFNIVDAYAPCPSEKEAIKAILDPML